MIQRKIPFNRPSLTGNELNNIASAIKNGHISGAGQFTSLVEEKLSTTVNATGKVLLTTSCTHALEMSAILANIQPGDEVIVPSFTFVTTALAFVMQGATPIFCDIKSNTLNIDENQIESLITERTKAIVVVHYAGVACEMTTIVELCKKHNILLIEDNAHGLFASYRGQCLGSIGDLATQSFHETKNIYCGEGGALIINNAKYSQRAEIIREKGTDRSRFFRGEVDKYSWVDKGSSYVMSDMLAAFLLAQLDDVKNIQSKRQYVWQQYNNELALWAEGNDIKTPYIPPHCTQAYHMYYLILPTSEYRQAFIEHLNNKGISAVFHYLPLHESPIGKDLGSAPNGCPISSDLSSRLVRLPFFHDLQEDEQQYIIEHTKEFQCQ